MRLTTKIIAGIILSVFIISLLHIIIFSFTDRKNYQMSIYSHSINLSGGTNPRIDVKPYRVIAFVADAEQSDTNSKYAYYFNYKECGLFIYPAPTREEDNTLIIPVVLNDYISTQINKDTLTVKIKMYEVLKKYGFYDEAFEKGLKPGMKEAVQISGFNLFLHTSNVNIINKLSGIQTKVSKIETDSIIINSTGNLVIDSCKTKLIDPVFTKNFTVTNCVAKTINIDLDYAKEWRVDNCYIDESNYTGSRNHSFNIFRSKTGSTNEIRNWLPKNKDAQLNINLKGDTAQIRVRIQ